MIKVAQCWDNGVATDIRLIEILRKYNARATFNLCPGLMGEEAALYGMLDKVVKPIFHDVEYPPGNRIFSAERPSAL